MVVVKYKDPVTGEWKLASAIVLNNEVPGLDTSIVEYSHMNDNLTAYLKAAEIYTDDNHSMTVMSNYLSADSEGDDPIGPVVTIDEDGTLYVLDETTGRATKASAREGEKTIYNLIPDHVYQWFVKDGDGKVVSSGRLKPTGSVRMLKFLYSGIRNFRDLGGWECDGGTIKYGLLIRGGFFGDKEADPDNRKLAEDIGIKHEVDLRDEATATESPIGKHVHYYCYPISTYYADIVNGTDRGSYESAVKALRSIFNAVKYGECCYWHCSLGADRCGTISWMIEALLGMARRDMDKDYEITTFYVYPAQSSTRYRNRTDYRALNDYLPTFEDVIRWYLNAGFSIDELNAFRSAAIDGTPSVLASPIKTYNVANHLTFCTNANVSTSAVEGGRYQATIVADSGYRLDSVTVTMGGTDITSSAYNDGVIVIGSVTGDVEITASASSVATYTNVLPLAIDTDGSVYNGKGWKDQTRISSSGGDTSANGMSTTGYIPCKLGDVIRLRGINHDTNGDTNYRLVFYTSAFAKTSDATIQAGGTTSAQNYQEIDGAIDSNGYLTQFTVQAWSTSNGTSTADALKNVAYFRICGKTFASNAVITVNESIN